MNNDPNLEASKRAVVEALLNESAVMVTLDATRPGVVVPPYLAAQTDLTLRFGSAVAQLIPPIFDLDVGPETLSGTLSFNGAPFFVAVPWQAIYAAQGKVAAYWPASAPAGSVDPVVAAVRASVPPKEQTFDDRVDLAVIAATRAPPPPQTAAEIKAAKRAHLKLV